MKRTKTNRTSGLALAGRLAGMFAAAAVAATANVEAGDTVMSSKQAPPMVVEEEEAVDWCERIFAMPTLYSNPENPFIQEFAITGRYQGQYHYTDANTGEDDGWDHRRARLGFAMGFLEEFALKGQFNLDLEGDRFFNNVDTIYLEWEPAADVYLNVGKLKPEITQEYATSSSKILTFERSLLVNQVTPDKTGGVLVGYTPGPWLFELGAYTGDYSTDYELPEFDAGYALSGRVGYDINENVTVRFDYFHNDGDPDNVAFAAYDHIFSLNSASKWGRFGLNTDLIYAEGNERGDAYGAVIMPYYDITDKLQLVTRYQYAGGEDNDGIRLQSRYERPAVDDGSSDRGDDYHAIYAGLNYYICGHKLKLMTGVEYSTLGGNADYDGITYLGGVRLNF